MKSQKLKFVYAGLAGALVSALIFGVMWYAYVDRNRYEGPSINTSGMKFDVPKTTVQLREAIGKTPDEANRHFRIPNKNSSVNPVVVPLNAETSLVEGKISQICFNPASKQMIYEIANQNQLTDSEWRLAKAARNPQTLTRLVPAGCSLDPLITAFDVD
ncbi:hypothetical protein [Tsukamurella pseudospumae]|uniref:hypothetical protein n=1 Tax=Tsukamurella pseudospumae TaxID=239498 RepID=UPI000A66CC24|nr:hypothetical protein [Tsukamurella pseudospumae]